MIVYTTIYIKCHFLLKEEQDMVNAHYHISIGKVTAKASILATLTLVLGEGIY